MSNNPASKRCENGSGDIIHAIRVCAYAKEVLTLGGLHESLLDDNYTDYMDWLGSSMRERNSS
ncbi:hypothetical protein ERO13_D02G131300v2 [Gossypium hirsutum]|uniref:Uncharacterized protein n=1 Tax=Gossypium darwinii TaxID=34276 RepID=A0A5D2DDM8_GOSDA|nr:hypothetical protein ERO13_D02G131300v2 [Gossypium hirsutum]TYG79739.1 hypothetical protein ES288_D02G161400v1 [Gossypium darwinii]